MEIGASDMQNILIPKEHFKRVKVAMANELMRARQPNLSLPQKRLIAMAVAQLDSRKRKRTFYDEHSYKQAFTFDISAVDYSKICDIDLSESYKQIKEAADGLMDEKISMPLYDSKGNPVLDKKGNHVIEKFVLAQSAKYYGGEGRVEVMLSTRFTDFLCGLFNKYTYYDLETVCRLGSAYSFRFYELLMRFRSTGKYSVSVDEFCYVMGAPESYKKKFQMVKERLIDPCIKELSDCLDIEYEGIKKGRGKKITHISVTFKEKNVPEESASQNC